MRLDSLISRNYVFVSGFELAFSALLATLRCKELLLRRRGAESTEGRLKTTFWSEAKPRQAYCAVLREHVGQAAHSPFDMDSKR